MKRFISIFILVCFLVTGQVGQYPVQAQDFRLPAPGIMVHLSPPLDPPILKGIKVHPDNPFRFDFILDKGDSELSNDQIKDASSKLIKYFLASLTIPEKDLWVNLSPYEKDRIIPNSFGLTEMGRDLLAEDYMLKQITASLIYPEDEVGKRFWKRIYEEADKRYGTTNIPVNTFNKVWIVPEKAVVYENAQAGTAYVVTSKLKVMLEQDYLSLQKHEGISSVVQTQGKETSQLGSQIVREVIIPELTKEVNEDKNFAKLRQVYNSLILATWYKKKIKDSILEQVYADKNKVAGINIADPQEKQRIYEQYLRAFKKGVFNYIKEETDTLSQETIPRKYFSGGEEFTSLVLDPAMTIVSSKLASLPASVTGNSNLVTIDSQIISTNETGGVGSFNGNNDSWNRRDNINPDGPDENLSKTINSLKKEARWEKQKSMLNAVRQKQAEPEREKAAVILNKAKDFLAGSALLKNLPKRTRERIYNTELIVSDDAPTYAAIFFLGRNAGFQRPVILVNAEFIRKATDAQIAFVMGHELGHILLEHVNDILNRYDEEEQHTLWTEIERRADAVGVMAAVALAGVMENDIMSIFDVLKSLDIQVEKNEKKWGLFQNESDRGLDPHMSDKERTERLDHLRLSYESGDRFSFLERTFDASWPEGMDAEIHLSFLEQFRSPEVIETKETTFVKEFVFQKAAIEGTEIIKTSNNRGILSRFFVRLKNIIPAAIVAGVVVLGGAGNNAANGADNVATAPVLTSQSAQTLSGAQLKLLAENKSPQQDITPDIAARIKWTQSEEVKKLLDQFDAMNPHTPVSFDNYQEKGNLLLSDNKKWDSEVAKDFVYELAAEKNEAEFYKTVRDYIKFGMIKAIILPKEEREELYKNRLDHEARKLGGKFNDDRPLALVIKDTSDWNGALKENSGNLFYNFKVEKDGKPQVNPRNVIESLISQGYRVLYTENSDWDGVVKSISDFTQFEPASIFIPNAHGNPKSLGSWLKLPGVKYQDETTAPKTAVEINADNVGEWQKKLQGRIKMTVLDSCSTGGACVGPNVADEFSHLTGTTVIAPKDIINGLIFDRNSKENLVEFLNGDDKVGVYTASPSGTPATVPATAPATNTQSQKQEGYQIIGHRHSMPGLADLILDKTIKLGNDPAAREVYKKHIEEILQDGQSVIKSEMEVRDQIKSSIEKGQALPAIGVEMSQEEFEEASKDDKVYLELFDLVFQNVWPNDYKDKAEQLELYLFGAPLLLYDQGILKKENLFPIDSEELKQNGMKAKEKADAIISQLPKNDIGHKAFIDMFNAMLDQRKSPSDEQINSVVNAYAQKDRPQVRKLIGDAVAAGNDFLEWAGSKRDEYMANMIAKMPKGSIIYIGANHAKEIQKILEEKGIKVEVWITKDSAMSILILAKSVVPDSAMFASLFPNIRNKLGAGIRNLLLASVLAGSINTVTGAQFYDKKEDDSQWRVLIEKGDTLNSLVTTLTQSAKPPLSDQQNQLVAQRIGKDNPGISFEPGKTIDVLGAYDLFRTFDTLNNSQEIATIKVNPKERSPIDVHFIRAKNHANGEETMAFAFPNAGSAFVDVDMFVDMVKEWQKEASEPKMAIADVLAGKQGSYIYENWMREMLYHEFVHTVTTPLIRRAEFKDQLKELLKYAPEGAFHNQEYRVAEEVSAYLAQESFSQEPKILLLGLLSKIGEESKENGFIYSDTAYVIIKRMAEELGYRDYIFNTAKKQLGRDVTQEEKDTFDRKFKNGDFFKGKFISGLASFFLEKTDKEEKAAAAKIFKEIYKIDPPDIGEFTIPKDVIKIYQDSARNDATKPATQPQGKSDTTLPNSDKGMLNKGGIDLTPANMNLQMQNNGGEIKFHLDPSQLAQLQNAPGFTPLIISVQPLNNLSLFLSFNNQDNGGRLSRVN